MSAEILVLVSDPSVAGFRLERVAPDLDTMQRLVGGFIEGLHGEGWAAYFNEEGKLEALKPNQLSTLVMNQLMPGFAHGDFLVGSVVWFGNTGGPNEVDVTWEMVDRFAWMLMKGRTDEAPISVLRVGKDVWVYDRGDDELTAKINILMGNVRDDVHLEFYAGITPGKWTEIRVDIMDDWTINLHDMRDDRSYG